MVCFNIIMIKRKRDSIVAKQWVSGGVSHEKHGAREREGDGRGGNAGAGEQARTIEKI